MFVKVFRQIFESSIAEDYSVRHIFMDLLVLADIDGVIDKTHEAIARITNVPLEEIRRAIAELESPDPKSRSDDEDGRRLVRLDDHRDWGWQIVNYEAYRQIRDEEARRAYFRNKKREYRQKVKDSQTSSNGVQPRLGLSNLSTKEEEEEDAEGEREIKPPTPLQGAVVVFPENLDSDRFKKAWDQWKTHRIEKRKKMTPSQEQKQLDRLEGLGPDRAIAAIDYSIAQGWTGIFEENLPPGSRPLAPSKNDNPKEEAQKFVTREMVEDWCIRKGYSKLYPIAWGKLMAGKHFGVVIDNREDFEAAISHILSDWKKER